MNFKATKETKTESRKHWLRYLKGRKTAEDVPLLPVSHPGEKATDGEDDTSSLDEEVPFELIDISLRIPKGSFVAIVGHIGSGKVTLDTCQNSNAVLNSLRALFSKH